MDISAFVELRHALNLNSPRHRRGPRELYIYGLYDRRDMRVRYVGVTKRPLSDRLLMHKQRPTNASMRSWLSSSSGYINAALLETVPTREWEDAERGWIEWFRRRGALYNVDQGGIARDESGALLPWTPGEFREPPRGEPPKRKRPRGRRPPPIIVPLPVGEVYVPPFDYRTAKRLAELSARQMASLRRPTSRVRAQAQRSASR